MTTDRRFAIRFSLGTLFAITVLVAVITAIVVRTIADMPTQTVESWTTTALNGICGGCAVLLGVWTFTSKRKRFAWPVALAVCLGLAAIMARFDWFVVSFKYRQAWPPDAREIVTLMRILDASKMHLALVWFAVIPAVMAGIWLTLCAWSAAVGTAVGLGEPTGGVRRRVAARPIVARCIFGSLLAVLAVPPALVVWNLLHPLPIPNVVVPQPNGFDDIVAAGQALKASPMLSTTVRPRSTEELAAEIAKQAGAYERLRLGLSRDIRARIWTKDGDDNWTSDWSQDRWFAAGMAGRGLMREAELSQQQGRYGDAARIGLENIRLGHAVARDGVSSEYSIGMVIERFGDQTLCQVLPHLDAEQCRETMAALVEIERGRESLDDAQQRGRAWCAQTSDWFSQFRLMFEDGREMRLLVTCRVAGTRLLILELALRTFQLERGILPDRVEQLTPEFLAELPVDPFHPEGRPLRYRRTEDGHIVYSIGADGKDDGGRPQARNEGGGLDPAGDGDVLLDTLFPSDKDADEDDMDG